MKQYFTFFAPFRLLPAIWLSVFSIQAIPIAHAAPLLSVSDLSITLTTGPDFLIDANSGCGAEPNASYVGYEICNETADTLWQVTTHLGDFTQSGSGLAGGQQATQRIGSLAPGACRTLYWYVYYDCDDASAYVEMTLTVSDTSATSVSQTEIVGIRDVITASAGGVIVTTDDSIGGYVGSIVIMDYLYSFGNMKKNGEVYMQPAGNLDFAADCFQLIGSEILASDVIGVDAGDRDQIYYVLPSNTNGSDHEIEVRYYFLNLCEGVSTEARGYAAATSGNDLKLSPNIGDPSIDFSLPEAVSPFVISKSVDVLSVAPGESAAYTVTLTNSSAQSIVVDQIKDVLPPDFTFDTTLFNSDINVTNAAKFPARGDADTLRWWGGTASSTYPYREFLLGPGSSLNLRYTASASLSPTPGEHINYAQAISGSYATPYVAAALCVGGYPCTLQAGEWQFFEAARIAGGIRLAWSVFQVASSVSFAVERSRNGSDFEVIASLAGDAFAGETNAYEYEDPLPPSPIGGTTCYRIKWIHADGLASYSPIESVFQAQHAQPALHIYTAGGPNRFRIQYNQPATGKIKFRITDSVGHTILSRTEQSNSLEVSGLPSGMYMVRVSDGKVATSSKFIVSGQ